MAKIAKKRKNMIENLDLDKQYEVEEAIEIVKKNATAKFDETIEITMNTGVDPKHSEQIVRGVCQLPQGLGKNIKVAVFARGNKADEAKKAGADIVGAEELVQEIEQGNINFDRAIATPDVMPIVGKIGKILGPRGLMPNPRLGSVTVDVAAAVKAAKAGAVEYRVDKAGIIHAPIGKASFSAKKIIENFKSFIESVKAAKTAAIKGNYIKKISLSSTMGVGIKVKIASV